MKIDMHVHSKYSVDGKVEPVDVVRWARKIGLSGVAITDHNEIRGALLARDYARGNRDFTVLVGEEISTSHGHLLAYNITERIEKGLSPEETIERVNDQGGFAVAAHPGRFPNGMKRSKIRELEINGIEVLNGYSVPHKNWRARKLAYEMDRGMVGGSDAHRLKDVGRAFTRVAGTALTPLDIEQNIQAKRSTTGGRSVTYHRMAFIQLFVFAKWLRRGCRNI